MTVTINGSSGLTANDGSVFTNASGNVGIGTSSPSYKLEVAGNATLNATSNPVFRLAEAGSVRGLLTASSTIGVGIETNGALPIAMNTNGSERMRIDSSGNVGIGTSSPGGAAGQTNVEVVGSAGRGNLTLNTTQADGTDVAAGSIAFRGGPSTSGSAESRIALISATTEGATANNRGGVLAFNTKANNGALVERMRINSNGNLFLGTTTNPTSNSTGIINAVASSGDAVNIKHTVNGNNMFNLWQTGTTTYSALNFNKGDTQLTRGNISVSTGGVAYNTTSDYRLKENVQPMSGALAKVAALKPVTYKWNADGSDGEGFIAHELQAVCPSAVTGEKDAVDEDGNPKYQGIDTSFLVATLTAALQEAHGLITALTARVEALENQA